jgi:hypothetical protein
MRIKVTQIVNDLSDGDDRAFLPAGENRLGAWSEYSFASLDEFHRTIPIGCLEDFEIEVVEGEDRA